MARTTNEIRKESVKARERIMLLLPLQVCTQQVGRGERIWPSVTHAQTHTHTHILILNKGAGICDDGCADGVCGRVLVRACVQTRVSAQASQQQVRVLKLARMWS